MKIFQGVRIYRMTKHSFTCNGKRCFSSPTVLSETTKIYDTTKSNNAKRSTYLKTVLAQMIPVEKERIENFRRDHGPKKVCEVTVDMIWNGMRNMKGLICETSTLDPEEGIKFRGFSISECQKILPKAKGGNEPLPEGVFWLLLTGEVPTLTQVQALSKEWAERATIPPHVVNLLDKMPATMHPMSQLSSAITAMSTESTFSKAYANGVQKETYWEYVFEDAMNLIAKMPVIAASIYRNTYSENKLIHSIDVNTDWSANFSHMLGYKDPRFIELLRLFMSIHSDHEGGNVCAHTVHLVGSALSDPYLAFAAGVNGLAGPLHGLASQQVVLWLKQLQLSIGEKAPEDKIRMYVKDTLQNGNLIPGYGHPVLRKVDPRFLCQREFANKHLPDDPLCCLVSQLYKVVPAILEDAGVVSNPWPNVDAHSGVMLHHFGMTEVEFYAVLFAVSRSLGVLASLVWDRALELPMEHPESFSIETFMSSKQFVAEKHEEMQAEATGGP